MTYGEILSNRWGCQATGPQSFEMGPPVCGEKPAWTYEVNIWLVALCDQHFRSFYKAGLPCIPRYILV